MAGAPDTAAGSTDLAQRERSSVRRMIERIVRVIDGVSGALGFAALLTAVGSLGVMFVYTTLGVLGRYTGWFEVLSADEIGGWALAGLFFLGLPYSFRKRQFVRVGVLYSRLRRRGQVAADAVFCAVSLAAAILLTYYFWEFIRQSYNFHLLSIGVVQIHLYIPQLAVGVGMTLFSLEVFATLLRVLVFHETLGTDEEAAI